MTTSVEEAALLAAILADPAEDTPRLVYADWLQESGHGERAEFIRVQIELARYGLGMPCEYGFTGARAPCECRVCALRLREDRLHGCASAKHWRMLPWGLSARRDFERGFLFQLTTTAGRWLAHAHALLAAHPVTKVRLTTWPDCDLSGSTDSDIDDREEFWELTASDGTSWDGEHEYGRWFPRGTEPDTPAMVRAILAAAWPRVAFELPPC